MPACPSTQLRWAFQRRLEGKWYLVAQFKTDRDCLLKWERKMEGSEFEAQTPHGEWVADGSSGRKYVFPSYNGPVAVVMLPLSRPLEGIDIKREHVE